MDPAMLKISPLVAQALTAGHPVVALESTIISHGRAQSVRTHGTCSMHASIPSRVVRILSAGLRTRHMGMLCMFLHAGMPYPQNLQTALEVEDVISRHGAVPATIAIIQGQPCIGRGSAAG